MGHTCLVGNWNWSAETVSLCHEVTLDWAVVCPEQVCCKWPAHSAGGHVCDCWSVRPSLSLPLSLGTWLNSYLLLLV